MKILKKIFKWFLYFLAIPVIYIIVSLILTTIIIDKKDNTTVCNKSIFLNTNGVHLDIILSRNDIDTKLIKGINQLENENYISFGWGDENFYLNTPTWNDLTFSNAFQAMFLKSSTLMHITRYKHKRNNWVEIRINESELQKLNIYILKTFKKDEYGNKIILDNKGYSEIDDFYKAEGSYSCFKTCNSWVNTGFKESGLKSCYWTPFDFELLKNMNEKHLLTKNKPH